MRKHNGMRPQDILILLKLVSLGDTKWRYADVAKALYISQSEVAEGLHRNMQARLIAPDKRRVFRSALMEFLTHGIKYVFPTEPGAIVRGVPTAHSAAPLSDRIAEGEESYVWPSDEGTMRGQAIQPLYPTTVAAALADPEFYKLLALVDALRVGKAREQKIAIEELRKRIQGDAYSPYEPSRIGNRSPGIG